MVTYDQPELHFFPIMMMKERVENTENLNLYVEIKSNKLRFKLELYALK